MITTASVSAILGNQKILPLFYHPDQAVCAGVLQSLHSGGIKMVEFTNRGEQALSRFKELHLLRKEKFPEMILAAGTIRSSADAEAFLNAGADLLISPCFDEGVAHVANRSGAVWLPGCMTPTEIHQATTAGIKLVKLFPGNIIGAEFVKAVRPLFPDVQFVVTGGVEPTMAGILHWLQAGVLAAGLGGQLISNELMERQQFNQLEKNITELLLQLQIK
jgi:2-dehydro-3-deoxyphosphogluconate aldolase/(4S)-4-hydroxy-2-oxoglutarate aldolase